ncbi:MAG: cytochrome b5 domain-containing protein [Sterolibacterium sp.]|jgi:hypothetical protein|nr:cytochrome b5 domain-containing protein [Sterolibacterium sp.]
MKVRRWFLVATGLFWLLVLAAWVVSRLLPPVAVPSARVAPVSAGYTLAQVAQHASEQDCWMAIDGSVYDLSAYLPDHPARSGLIEVWCGRQASDAYHTKQRGRPHSAQADALLHEYRIGTLGLP